MSRRAIISAADLRRMAKVSREQGVTITNRIDANGHVTVQFTPAGITHHNDDSGDLDARIDAFASK